MLDIDRDRQRISLGLKQTQEDPWERVVRTYNVGDVLEGKVTKVVSFGAFVEIMEGVEGLVHISELAQHHVENPREVVEPGRRGEGQDPRDRQGAPAPVAEPEAGRGPGAASAGGAARPTTRQETGAAVPDLGLSEEVFAPEAEAPAEAEAPRQPRRRRSAEAPAEADGPRSPPQRPKSRVAEAAAPAAESAGSRAAGRDRRRARAQPEPAAEEQT